VNISEANSAGLEERRLILQGELDARKDPGERNRMGQFSTPTGLAAEILRYARAHSRRDGRIRFIDPAVGTGSFHSALLNVFPKSRIDAAVGYEIDPHYGMPAARLWEGTGLDLHVKDFTRTKAPPIPDRFNLLICNPPYVRHHHIASGEKGRLKAAVRESCDTDIGGLAGLYCYFLGLCHAWMAEGGLAGWLIPSEFMDVNYGASVKRYLLDRVTLMHIHRFDPNDMQFGDAMVSSAVVWFRKETPRAGHEVRFSYGGSLEQPAQERMVSAEVLRCDPKWTRYPARERYRKLDQPVLGDFFRIKRGLVTGDNDFFILPAEEIERRGLPIEAFRPILPGPRHLPEDEVRADERGNPSLERRLFLLDCPLGEDEIGRKYPELSAYLDEGRARSIPERYVCRHRTPWYGQENRPPAPFMCTYLGRSGSRNGRPFRFIMNNSRATAANVYLMLYPKEPIAHALAEDIDLRRRVWRFLNGICPYAMLGEGRVYGGGLHKLEPKELANVPAGTIAGLLSAMASTKGQRDMFEPRATHTRSA